MRSGLEKRDWIELKTDKLTPMNVLRMIAAIVVVTVLVLSYSVSSASSLAPNPVPSEVSSEGLLFDNDFEFELQNFSGPINAQLTSEVKRRIRQYLSHKSWMQNILARKDLYFPTFEYVMAKYNVPKELKYLAVVESALNPNARSKAGAVGLWQLMKPTGRMLGLAINRTLDHRRDPIHSTEAAMKYLKGLYDEFDDWTLAIAAYNSGPGRVRKAIRLSGSRDFWKLKRFLPKETRNYVPAFIAVSYMINNYTAHGIEPKVFDDELRFTSVIKVYDYISFKELSEQVGISKSTIKTLNPAYLKSYIPKYASGNYLVLPAMAMNKYLDRLWSGDKEPKVDFIKLKSFESFKTIRSINAVERINPYTPERILRLSESNLPEIIGWLRRNQIRSKSVRYYRLKRRESLKDLARSQKNITVKNLMEWNDISSSNPPKPGMLIKVYEF